MFIRSCYFVVHLPMLFGFSPVSSHIKSGQFAFYCLDNTFVVIGVIYHFDCMQVHIHIPVPLIR